MKSMWLSRFSAYLVTFGLFFALQPVVFAQNSDSEEISKLLAHAQSHAMSLDNDADTLVAYTRSNVGWQSHSSRLNDMKNDVNEMGKIVADMQQQRSEGSPWQQAAIDRVYPLLREMADALTATIKHLNDHPTQVNMPPYQDYVQSQYEVASRTASLVKDLVDYGRSKKNSDQIRQRLELPEKAGQ